MKFPKKQINELQRNLTSFFDVQCHGQPASMVACDPKDLEDVILYAELSNARVQELEQQLHEASIKLHMVRSAIRD